MGLLGQRNFALLWVGGTVSALGDVALFVALPFYVYVLTHSALATSGMFVAETLPRLLFGSIAGVFVDRWDRRRTMIVADCLRMAVILLLLVLQSPQTVWIVYVVAGVQATIGQFFTPAASALLPRVVGEEELVTANGLSSVSGAIVQLAGPSLGGLVYAALGFPAVVVVDSATFLFSATCIALLALPRIVTPGAVAEAGSVVGTIVRGWMEGFGYLWSKHVLMVLLASFCAFELGQGMINVDIVVFVKVALHGGPETLGWLITAQGVGGLLGGLLVGRFGERLPRKVALVAGGVTPGAFLVVIALLPVLPLVLALVALLGMPVVAYNVMVTALLQQETSDAFRGRVFGALGTVTSVAMLVSLTASGVLIDLLGPFVLLVGAGVLFALGGLICLGLPRGRSIFKDVAVS